MIHSKLLTIVFTSLYIFDSEFNNKNIPKLLFFRLWRYNLYFSELKTPVFLNKKILFICFVFFFFLNCFPSHNVLLVLVVYTTHNSVSCVCVAIRVLLASVRSLVSRPVSSKTQFLFQKLPFRNIFFYKKRGENIHHVRKYH